MADTLGARLRASRQAAGLSLGELAKRVNYSKAYLSKIENGLKPLTADIARHCDHALTTGGALLALVRTTPQAQPPAAADGEVWVLAMDDGDLRFQPMARAQVAANPGVALGFTTARGVSTEPDEPTLLALRAQFDQQRALGAIASPALVLGQLVAHVNTVRALAATSPEPSRSWLLRLGSRAMEYAGWMHQEAGDTKAARWWTERAVELAARGGDPHLASYALFRHAELALYDDDPLSTIELATRAQAGPDLPARIRGLAAQSEAQGHALAGDASAHQRALDRATELLARHEPSDGPVLGSSTVADQVALARGWSLFDLGTPGPAAELLDQHVPTIGSSARRARARFGARRLLAHADHGDIERACALAPEVLADAAHVDSATVRSDLARVAQTLARWRSHPGVRELEPELRAALHVRRPC